MKRFLRGLIRPLIILVGLAILIYPSLSEYLSLKNSSRVLASYDDSVARMREAEQNELLELAQDYNRQFTRSAGYESPRIDAAGKPGSLDSYWSVLDLGAGGMMGYISIPKLNETIPIYHGTAEEVLQVGVGHVENTSLPVGGESTHAALSGHRGLPHASLFTDLDQLQIGDRFYIKILNQTLCYTVDQILTVLPSETEALAIQPGGDYVTLITCTPYGVNSHRLLVRGARTPYEPAPEDELDVMAVEEDTRSFFEKLPAQYRHMLIGAAVLVVFLVVRGIILIILYFVRKRRNAKHEKAAETNE